MLTPAQAARARMAEQPFAPGEGGAEHRAAHALEYIAYYLGEIVGKLDQINGQLNSGATNSAAVARSVAGIAQMLPTLLNRGIAG